MPFLSAMILLQPKNKSQRALDKAHMEVRCIFLCYQRFFFYNTHGCSISPASIISANSAMLPLAAASNAPLPSYPHILATMKRILLSKNSLQFLGSCI